MPDLSIVERGRPSALEELVRDFLDDRIAANLSSRTIENDYRPRLERVFLPWARENDILEPAQLDQRTVNRFSTHLHTVGGPKGPLAPHSVSTYTKTVNAFLAWLRRQPHGDRVTGKAHQPEVARTGAEDPQRWRGQGDDQGRRSP